MNNRQRFMFLLTLLALLIFAGVAFAQAPTDEPTPAPTPEPTEEPVAIIDAGEGAQTDITVNVPAAEAADSETSVVSYIALFVAVGSLIGFAIQSFRINGRDVASTITAVSDSQQFTDVFQTLGAAIPPEVHRRALDTIDSLNERLKDALAVGGAITAAIDKIADKPSETPPVTPPVEPFTR